MKVFWYIDPYLSKLAGQGIKIPGIVTLLYDTGSEDFTKTSLGKCHI